MIQTRQAEPSTTSLSFLGQVEISTPALGASLAAIANDAGRPEHIRAWAIRLARSKGVADAELVSLVAALPGKLQEEVEQALIERQQQRCWPTMR